jgi:hypothetical protein
MAMHRYAFWTQVHPATSPALSSSKSESNKSSKINKYKKVRQLAIRFSAPEKVRKRSLLQQARPRELVCGGFDELVIKSEFQGSTPKLHSSTVSYGLTSGLSTPTHPPILTALDGRAQHELRTPAMQSVSSSKSLNIGMYDSGRLLYEQETLPLYGHQTPFCFDRPHALGSYARVSHGQLKSIPSGYHAISDSKREQSRNEAIRVLMTDDHDLFLDTMGSSQLTLPRKVDVYDEMDICPPTKRSQEYTARLYEHGLSSWAQLSRPSTFYDAGRFLLWSLRAGFTASSYETPSENAQIIARTPGYALAIF